MKDSIYHNGIGAESLEDTEWCYSFGCREKIQPGQEWWEDENGSPICYRCACTLYGECDECHYPTEYYRRRGDAYICLECAERLGNEDQEEEARRFVEEMEADQKLREGKGD